MMTIPLWVLAQSDMGFIVVLSDDRAKTLRPKQLEVEVALGILENGTAIRDWK
jgi:hypothetical protein